MSSPSTRETVTGLDKAEFLGTAIRTQLASVSPRLAEVFSLLPPRGEGEPPRQLDWDEVQVHNAELIEQAVVAAQEASQAYRVAKIRVADFAADRREANQGLRRRHRSHRKILNGSFGPRGLMLTGLDVPPVTTMLGMREQSILVLKRYEDPSLPDKLAAIPEEEVKGPLPDLAALASDLKADIEAFETAQDGWTRAKKVRDEAIVARTAARRRLRRIVTNLARVQEGYYRLVGLDDLADRLRLTVRRSRSRKAKTDEPDEGSPDEGSPGEGSPDVPSLPPVNEA